MEKLEGLASQDNRRTSTENDLIKKNTESTLRLPSVDSSELSEYYKHMSKEFIEEEFLGVEARVDKTFRDIGGCGCFQYFAYLAIALGIHS